MGAARSWLGVLCAGCFVAAGVAASTPARAELVEVRGLTLTEAGPLNPGTRDGVLARAARGAIAEAWRARHPDRPLPFLSDQLVGKAVRHVELLAETIAPDRYTATLDVGVAMEVLRTAAGVPAPVTVPMGGVAGAAPAGWAGAIRPLSAPRLQPLRIGVFAGDGREASRLFPGPGAAGSGD